MDDVIWNANSVMWIHDGLLGSWIVCISGISGGKPGSPHKTPKASHLLDSYLNPTITPCIILSLFILLCIVFYIAIILYIAIVDDLAPQVDLISSMEMTPLWPIQHPLLLETWWLASKSLENL
jgi:hypothetical protein